MDTQFYIIFNMRTTDGWVPYGKFFIGNDRSAAKHLFSLLNGSPNVEEDYPLTIDFMETVDGLPVNLDMINCTLQQLEENTGIITKELFRLQFHRPV